MATSFEVQITAHAEKPDWYLVGAKKRAGRTRTSALGSPRGGRRSQRVEMSHRRPIVQSDL